MRAGRYFLFGNEALRSKSAGVYQLVPASAVQVKWTARQRGAAFESLIAPERLAQKKHLSFAARLKRETARLFRKLASAIGLYWRHSLGVGYSRVGFR